MTRMMSKRSAVVAGALLAGLLAVAMLALTPSFLVLALLPDAAAPSEITAVLPVAREELYIQFKSPRWPVGYYQLVATETRASDNLVVLHFEYRTYPFITASSAYLASRCSSLSQVDPKAMSGGRGPDTESELKYLRSAAQPSC